MTFLALICVLRSRVILKCERSKGLHFVSLISLFGLSALQSVKASQGGVIPLVTLPATRLGQAPLVPEVMVSINKPNH